MRKSVADVASTARSFLTGKTLVYRGEPDEKAFKSLLEDAEGVYFNRARSNDTGDAVHAANQIMDDEERTGMERFKYLMTASASDFNKPRELAGTVAAEEYTAQDIPNEADVILTVEARNGALSFEYRARWKEDVEDRLSEMPKVSRTFEGRIRGVGEDAETIGQYMRDAGFSDDELRV